MLERRVPQKANNSCISQTGLDSEKHPSTMIDSQPYKNVGDFKTFNTETSHSQIKEKGPEVASKLISQTLSRENFEGKFLPAPKHSKSRKMKKTSKDADYKPKKHKSSKHKAKPSITHISKQELMQIMSKRQASAENSLRRLDGSVSRQTGLKEGLKS